MLLTTSSHFPTMTPQRHAAEYLLALRQGPIVEGQFDDAEEEGAFAELLPQRTKRRLDEEGRQPASRRQWTPIAPRKSPFRPLPVTQNRPSPPPTTQTLTMLAPKPTPAIMALVLGPRRTKQPLQPPLLMPRPTPMQQPHKQTPRTIPTALPSSLSDDLSAHPHPLVWPARMPLSPTTPSTTLQQPRDTDILLGRGGNANHHPGNVWWRQLVASYQPLYVQTPKFEKLRLAQQLVQFVRPRRFLRLESSGGGVYTQVSDHVAVQKASQALRDQRSAVDQR